MAYIQPAIPGGQFAPPLPWPDNTPAPPGAVVVAQGPVPPPPPGFPALPGYNQGPSGMLPGWPSLPGFAGGGAPAAGDVAGAAAMGAAGAMLGPFSVFAGVPLFVLVLGVILAAFLLYIFLKPLVALFVKGTTSATSLLLLMLPLILIGGLVLLLACNSGGGGQSWVLFGALAIMLLIFIPLFALFPSFTSLLTP